MINYIFTFTFIIGYIRYKVSHKLKFCECTIALVKDKILELVCSKEAYKYFMLSDKEVN